MGIIKIVTNLCDPFGVLRLFIVKPINETIQVALQRLENKTKENVSSAKDVAIKATLIAFVTAIIIWAAIFMYIVFYYTYMPAIAHVRPVNMQFKACNAIKGPCTFPHAHVSLTKRQQLLMVGQPYKVLVYIDMPESPQNQDLGMFMVCAEMRNQLTQLRDHSCRSTMLHYKSTLVRTMTTWIFSPLYVFGIKEEKQQIGIELFGNYEDDQSHPVTDVYVEIQSKQIQFYSVTLQITAHFTGLRYIMFHWPILSASIGISTNLFFIVVVSILSWYHWGDAVWIQDARKRLQRHRIGNKRSLDSEVSTSIDESSNVLLDDEELIASYSYKSDDDIEELFADPSSAGSSGGDAELRQRKTEPKNEIEG